MLDIARDRDIVVVGSDIGIIHELSKILAIRASSVGVEDFLAIVWTESILGTSTDELTRCVDKQRLIVRFGFFEYHDTGRDRCPEKEVWRELDHSVDVVVIDEIFADFGFSSSSIEHSWELDDRSRPTGREPAQHMEREGEIGLGFGSEDTRRGETRIIDKDGIGVSFPVDRVGRIGDDRIKRFIIPVLRMSERISMRDIELFVVDIMEKHIDTTEVIGRDIDLLSVESLANIVFTEDFRKFQKERT